MAHFHRSSVAHPHLPAAMSAGGASAPPPASASGVKAMVQRIEPQYQGSRKEAQRFEYSEGSRAGFVELASERPIVVESARRKQVAHRQ